MLFWVHTFKTCDRTWGSTGLFRSCNANCKQQSQLRKIENTTRRYVLRKKFLNLLCWIFSFVDTCRYYWEHISRSFCWRRDDKLSLLVIVRTWNSNLSLEECLYVVLCKSSGNHQKVMLRTLTLAETKDIHQPRQPGWDAWGFIKKKNTYFYWTTSSLSKKESVALGPWTGNLSPPWTVHWYSIKLLFSQCRCSCFMSV